MYFSHVSGLTIISAPAEIYLYGTTYCLSYISIVLVCLIDYYVYLPVFYNLEITSIYEYIKMRFDNRTRLLVSFINLLAYILYLTVVIYVPALAFSQCKHFIYFIFLANFVQFFFLQPLIYQYIT